MVAKRGSILTCFPGGTQGRRLCKAWVTPSSMPRLREPCPASRAIQRLTAFSPWAA
jgi:hypothetical protein